MKNILQAFVLLATLALSVACGGPAIPDEIPVAREGCGDDHPLVGQTAMLSTLAHEVSGMVRVVDNCSMVIENFNYDGGGFEVRAIVSADRQYDMGVALSEDLRRDEGYENDTLELFLPEGVTLDDVGGLSIWCVPFGADFGEAVF